MPNRYDEFLVRVREISDYAAASSLLAWDQEVFMPAKGVSARARHKAALAALIHHCICDPVLGELIDELGYSELDIYEKANVREMKRARDRAVKIPGTLVRELTEVGSLAQQAWAQAKHQSDWSLFSPQLERLVTLKRQEAKAVGYSGEPYNALLDEFEPGAQVEEMVTLFSALRDELVPLIEKIVATSPAPATTVLRQPFPVTQQDTFGREVLQAVGYDFAAGRLDTSVHPFTQGMAIGDVRITTKYEEDDLGVGLYANLHEGGHALYEQGLPAQYEGTPVASAVSLGIHESQSRLWENNVGRSLEFWQYYLPRLQEFFPEQLEQSSAEELYRAANIVTPSLIRIEADEVTYNLHIILRLELERALMREDIQVDDLPRLWRQKVQDYFHLEVPDDAHGPLQDIHWAFGVFGYFPTYTLGNLYAAQFFAKASTDLGDLQGMIGRGEFRPLLDWLHTNIHSKGSLLTASELCLEVTGQDLSIQPFIDSMKQKFGDIYGL